MRELAHLLNCDVRTVADLEHGQRRIDVLELIALARVFDLNPQDLFAVVVRSTTRDDLINNFSRPGKPRAQRKNE